MKTRIFLRLFLSVALAASLGLTEARSAPGDLFVTDYGSGTILKFTRNGSKSIFASGLNLPRGLAFDRERDLFVVERNSGTVVRFTPEGSRSTFASELSEPEGLAFDGMGNLFVTESFGDIASISKFTPAGAKSTFTSGGSFLELAFDTSGNLFASFGSPTNSPPGIVRITPDGKFGIFAREAGPGLAFSGSGNLFTTDLSGSEIAIVEFTPAGSKTVFSSGVAPNSFAFDAAGNLFVAIASSGTILKFAPDGTKSTFASGLDRPFDLAFEPITEKLRNISARGFVQTGDNVLIGGFIAGGNALANNAVLVRAIGPSLSESGIPDPLADPLLELHNASGVVIASNDNWQETQAAEITASGLAPKNPKESAIFATLPAGNYTAIVRGANDTTGVALVEVYSVGQ